MAFVVPSAGELVKEGGVLRTASTWTHVRTPPSASPWCCWRAWSLHTRTQPPELGNKNDFQLGLSSTLIG